jgi:hypothetical protein
MPPVALIGWGFGAACELNPSQCAAEGQQPLMTLDCTKLKELGMEFIGLA